MTTDLSHERESAGEVHGAKIINEMGDDIRRHQQLATFQVVLLTLTLSFDPYLTKVYY